MNETVKRKIKSRDEVLSPMSHIKYPYNARKVNLQPIGTIENVVIFLTLFEEFKGQIKYNVFHQQVEFKGQRLSDDDIVGVWLMAEKHSGMINLKMEMVAKAMYFIASGNKYDPCIEYLNSLKWDKVERLEDLIPKSFDVEPNIYHRAIGHNWMLAIMNRQITPGYQWDYMITLVGQTQGLGKTSFFKTLVAGFDPSSVKILKSDFENKDTLKKMGSGALIVNIDEGAAFGPKAQNSIKTFITETYDEYRDPFAREIKVHQRRFVFGMTENNENPFGDATGNRRYWPVDVKTTVNFKWIEENREQLFAEAWHKAKIKTPMIAIPRELTDEIQESHREQDIWEEKIIGYLIAQKTFFTEEDPYFVKTTDVFKDVFDMGEVKFVEQKQTRRLVVCLKALGFVPHIKRIGNKVIRGYAIDKNARERIKRNLTDEELEKALQTGGTVHQQYEKF